MFKQRGSRHVLYVAAAAPVSVLLFFFLSFASTHLSCHSFSLSACIWLLVSFVCMCVSVHEKDFHWLGKKQMLQPNELYAAHMNRSWAMAYARELHTEKAIRTNNGESKLWNAHTSATDRQIERLRTKNQQAMEKKPNDRLCIHYDIIAGAVCDDLLYR